MWREYFYIYNSRNINKVTLIGNVGRTPELRETRTGTAVTDFSLATTSRWIDKDGQPQTKTEWHKIVVWGHQAESICENNAVRKGDLVYVDGSLTYREFMREEEKQDSEQARPAIIAEIEAFNVLRLSRRDNTTAATQVASEE